MYIVEIVQRRWSANTKLMTLVDIQSGEHLNLLVGSTLTLVVFSLSLESEECLHGSESRSFALYEPVIFRRREYQLITGSDLWLVSKVVLLKRASGPVGGRPPV